MNARADLALEAESSALLVIDVQERLLAAMPEERVRDLSRSAKILLGAARELGVPAMYTEQYPKGLGPTAGDVAAELQTSQARRFEKLAFSACGAEGFLDALALSSPRAVVVIGMEAHVCVWQTVRDLVSAGYAVHVPIDGAASRRDDHRAAGLELCRTAGARLTTSETVAFDWLKRAGTDAFRKVSALVR